MTKAVTSGMPKLRIEEAAARKQARIDSSSDVVRRALFSKAIITPLHKYIHTHPPHTFLYSPDRWRQ